MNWHRFKELMLRELAVIPHHSIGDDMDDQWKRIEELAASLAARQRDNDKWCKVITPDLTLPMNRYDGRNVSFRTVPGSSTDRSTTTTCTQCRGRAGVCVSCSQGYSSGTLVVQPHLGMVSEHRRIWSKAACRRRVPVQAAERVTTKDRPTEEVETSCRRSKHLPRRHAARQMLHLVIGLFYTCVLATWLQHEDYYHNNINGLTYDCRI